ncbi:MAG: ATP-dependent 6-phosphofructokinase [Deltaproteobacteria bacterium]|nr:ATP-dependent 6-phosphofructokinase [Deltaproteobacteria bacterium]
MKRQMQDFKIQDLGERKISSPLMVGYFKTDDEQIIYDIHLKRQGTRVKSRGIPISMEVAGPRETIYFDPPKVKAAIASCGGLCPGINDVIRAIVMELHFRYGVQNIIGIRYGFQGLIPRYGHEVMELTFEMVKEIQDLGGSILASSRGDQDIGEMVDALERMNINVFFMIGGDGTMRAAELITREVTRRNLKIGVIGIPKTIDNDLVLIQKSFGFDTAISEAVKIIQCAHVEAKGAPMGIGLVKLMGRQSGHIAASAAQAQGDANFVLIPEIPFDLEGEKGFLKCLEKRLLSRKHAVIIVAEGAGQDLIPPSAFPPGKDASGNLKLRDIGLFLRDQIELHFKKIGVEVNLKYIDPSYMIRSVPANAGDSILCGILGQYAVHAGMAGKTGMLVGLVNDEFVHLPFKAVSSQRKTIDPSGNMWMQVLESTGQPFSMKG